MPHLRLNVIYEDIICKVSSLGRYGYVKNFYLAWIYKIVELLVWNHTTSIILLILLGPFIPILSQKLTEKCLALPSQFSKATSLVRPRRPLRLSQKN